MRLLTLFTYAGLGHFEKACAACDAAVELSTNDAEKAESHRLRAQFEKKAYGAVVSELKMPAARNPAARKQVARKLDLEVAKDILAEVPSRRSLLDCAWAETITDPRTLRKRRRE